PRRGRRTTTPMDRRRNSMQTIGTRGWRAWVAAAVAWLAALPAARADYVFTGNEIPGVVVPRMLPGLGPVPPHPGGFGGAQVDLSNPYFPSLNTGDTFGEHVVRFGINLGGTPLPIDLNSFVFEFPFPFSTPQGAPLPGDGPSDIGALF